MPKTKDDDVGLTVFIVFVVIMIIVSNFADGYWVWLISILVFGCIAALGMYLNYLDEQRELIKTCSHHVKGAFRDDTLCVTCVAERLNKETKRLEEIERKNEIAKLEKERKHNAYVKNIRESSYLRSMNPYKFEDLCCDLFSRMGYDTESTSASGDHGADGYFNKDGELHILQAKRVQGSVGEPVLRDLYGTMYANEAHGGIVITTGNVSRQAKLWAKDKPIRIIELHELMKLIRLNYSENEVVPHAYKRSMKKDTFCPKCTKKLNIVKGPHGLFIGCSGFPSCRHTQKIP